MAQYDHHNVYEPEIKEEWEEFFDETTGRNYYAHMLTRETTWIMPDAFKRQQEAKSAPQVQEVANSAPGGNSWEMYFDDETGRNYWYNTESQQTTWEDPQIDNFGGAPLASQNSNIGGARIASPNALNIHDFETPDLPESPDPQHFAAGIESLPDLPPSPKPDITPGEVEEVGIVEADDVEVEDIGGKWRKVLDGSSNQHYYYHVDTHETTWTMPPEWENRLLMNHQDAVAKARASSLLITSQTEDEFNLPFLQPEESERWAQYAHGADSSDEEGSDFSDEVEGPKSGTQNPVSSVVAKKPPPKPMAVQQMIQHETKFVTPGSMSDVTAEAMYGRGSAPSYASSNDSEVRKKAKSRVQDADDSDEEFGHGHNFIHVDNKHSTEWQDFAKRNYKNFPMTNYAKDFFRPEVKGMFGTRTHQQDLSHSSHKLSKSLMNISSSQNAEAIETFRRVLAYMGDRKSTKQSEEYVRKLLSLTLGTTQQIQDEVFCQLIKQTTQNPNAESNLKGWELMAIVCGILAPSQTLVKYLSAYLYGHSLMKNEVGKWAEFALKRLDTSMRCGRRKWFPILKEIVCIKTQQLVNVKIHYLDGTFKSIMIDSQTRVDEAMNALCEELSIAHPEFYGLYEMEKVTQGHIQRFFDGLNQKKLKRLDKVSALIKVPIDRHLEKDERILDIMANWEYGQFNDRDFELVFKVRLMSKERISRLSKEGLHIAFIQSAYNVSYGFYPVAESTAWELAAIQCQGVFGVHEKQFWVNGLILSRLHHYLPYKMLQTKDKTASEVKILTMHLNYEQYERQDAHRMYIERLSEIDGLEEVLGAHFFPCVRLSRLKGVDGGDLNDLILLGISESGIVLMDPFTREITTFYPLKEILTYGFRQDAFLFVAGSIRKQKKWRLATYCGKAMNDLLLSYIQLKVQEAELQQTLQALTFSARSDD